MIKWEYKTARYPIFWGYSSAEWFNAFGENGWELCGKRDFNMYIFKRIKR